MSSITHWHETLIRNSNRILTWWTSVGVSFEDWGEQTLKGIAEPQRLFAV